MMTRFMLFLVLLLAACAGQGNTAPTPGPAQAGGQGSGQASGGAGASLAALAITSPDFATNTSIPAKYTCQGDDTSPALDWSAPPGGTKSLALIVDDPDAPGGVWVHWVVYNLPANSRGLPEGASQGKSTASSLPAGAVQGKNSFKRVNYGGPCPPSGEHHYRFHLYALDTTLSGDALDKAALLKAMNGHILGQGELVGLYRKQ